MKKKLEDSILKQVPVAYVGCCRFQCRDEDYAPVKAMLLDALCGKIDYQKTMDNASSEFPSSMTRAERNDINNAIKSRRDVIQRIHGTKRKRCNLDMTQPMGAGALNPGCNVDMTVFLLHLAHVIDVVDIDARRKIWLITLDEDTYTRTRKLIHYINVQLPASKKLDAMKLPDLSRFFLVPEFWHVGYVLLKHLCFGPKIAKGAPEEDGKRFGWRNFMRPLLVIMRRRGQLHDTALKEKLIEIGQSIPPNTTTMSWSKEKMSAEFRDMHLYLIFLLCGYAAWKTEYPMEHRQAVGANNIDLRCLFQFFESTIPITVDFVEHAHYSNITWLKYVLARIIVLLDQQHRTGYRRCLLQFLKDLIALPEEVQKLFLENFNSLCGVDIELLNGVLASVIPTVHRKPTEQQVSCMIMNM